MATQTQINAVTNFQAFGNRTDLATAYPVTTPTADGVEQGTTYQGEVQNPYEINTIRQNVEASEGALTMPETKLQQLTGFGVDSGTKSAVVFTYTDPNDVNNIESYGVYIWSSGLQFGKWFYISQADGNGGFTVDMTSLDAGDYIAKVEAEAYADGVTSTPTADVSFTLV